MDWVRRLANLNRRLGGKSHCRKNEDGTKGTCSESGKTN